MYQHSYELKTPAPWELEFLGASCTKSPDALTAVGLLDWPVPDFEEDFCKKYLISDLYVYICSIFSKNLLSVYVCIHTGIWFQKSDFRFLCMYIYIHMCGWANTSYFMCLREQACSPTHIYVYIHRNMMYLLTYTNVCIYMYMYAYDICIYMCVICKGIRRVGVAAEVFLLLKCADCDRFVHVDSYTYVGLIS
jgi:hypothetical protein